MTLDDLERLRKYVEINLKEVESKPHIWKVDLENKLAFCGTCDTWYKLEQDPGGILNHEHRSRHRNKKKAIEDAEDQKKAEDLRKEAIEQKKIEIIQVLEDHPNFLRWAWQPLGHFLRIFKVDLKNLSETSEEFFLGADSDEHEVMMEALEWLDL